MLGWIITIVFILIYFYLRCHFCVKSKRKIDWNHTEINYSKIRFKVWEIILYVFVLIIGILCGPLLLFTAIAGCIIIPMMILFTGDSYLYNEQYTLVSAGFKNILNFLNKEL